ncbi:MAG: right-handed parallel beta-helix repeat-containing protein [Nitrososphaera sp.]
MDIYAVRKLLFLTLFCIVLFEGEASATNYYVDGPNPIANDTNSGTEASPWKTPYAWINKVKAGDTVFVKNGTYTITGGDWNTPALNPVNSGTSTAPIVFKNYPGHSPKLAGSGSGKAVIGTQNRNYIHVIGFDIDNGRMVVDGAEFTKVLGFVAKNNRLHGASCPDDFNCTVLWIEDVDGVTLANNTFYNVHGLNDHWNAAAMIIYHARNMLIENNEFYDLSNGVFFKVDVRNSTIRYNWFHGPRLKRAISLLSMSTRTGDKHANNLVYGNIIQDATYATTELLADTSSPNEDSKIYNNTFANSFRGIFSDRDLTRFEIYNNIFYKTPNSIDPGDPSWSFCNYNLTFESGTVCGANSIQNTDPLFVSTAASKPADFKLKCESPAIKKGRSGENIGAYATGAEVIGVIP